MKQNDWLAMAAVLVALATSAAQANPGPGSVVDMYRAAQKLETAIVALAGDVSAPRNVEVELHGTEYNWHQGPTPNVPSTTKYRRIQKFLDWTAGEMAMVHNFYGLTYENETGTILPLVTGGPAHTATLVLVPHAVVHHMLQAPGSLFVLRNADDGTAISGTINGEPAVLDLDSNHLPVKLTLRYHDPFAGDATRTVEYLEYTSRGGLQMPGAVRTRSAGRLSFELTVESFGAPAARPPWTERVESLQSLLVDSSPEPRILPLAEHVYLVEFGDAFLYRAVLVDSDDGLLMLDAPQWLGDGGSLREAIDEQFGRPLTAVALSHHHADHSSGLAALAFDGIKVVTSPGNAEWAEAMLSAPRTMAGVAGTRNAELALVEGVLEIGHVVAYDAGPSRHADEHLVFYIPKARAVFQSDMGSFGPDGAAALTSASCALLAVIDSEQLDVDILIGSHGQVGPMAAFRSAMDENGGC